jgi:hypothetical protein
MPNVLQERTESHDSSRHGHHPEHAVDSHSMRGGCKYATDDDHDGGKDDGHLSAEVVTGQTILKLDPR